VNLPGRVQLIEVGLRDGLQNQPVVLPTAVKLEAVAGLIEAGLLHFQVASFVHPGKVPQMADAEAVCAGLPGGDGVTYSALVLNPKGVERAVAAGIGKVDASLSASEEHSRRNAGFGIEEARRRLAEMIGLARDGGLEVRAGIQCAFGCVFEGAIPVERVIALAEHLAGLGPVELALADSTGMATPRDIETVVTRVREVVGDLPLVLHLHDTRGLGLANLHTALQLGVTRFDTAFGGLGGCPFIPGATGNVATEDVVHLLESMGVTTGVDLARVAQVSARVEAHLGDVLPGKLYGLWKRERARTAETSA
jgi:hydroxymethylglutaryl-CoA lyase